ncbi:hypothetical protein ABPG74_013711 [Tetrahymena malaccensis]
MMEKSPSIFQEDVQQARKSSDTTINSINQELSQNQKNIQNLEVQNDKSQSVQKFSSKQEATVNLFKGYIGSGILALPYAFQQSGYLLATIIFLMIALIVYRTMDLLFQVAEKYGKKGMTYEQLAQLFFGRKGMFCVKFFIIIFQFGCCISYIIFFLKFFEHVFEDENETNKLHEFLYLCIALAIILPMNLINNISLFAKISFVANFFIICTLLAIIGYNIHLLIDSNTHQQNVRNETNLFDFSNLPLMIGVSIYSFECIGVIFSIKNTVEDDKVFKSIFKFTSVIITLLYVGFSILGAMAQGDSLSEIILFSLPKRSDVAYFQITYAIALVMSYPLQLLPSLQIIESSRLIKSIIKPQEKNYKMKRFFFRTFVTIIISSFAFLIPRFAIFLNLIGAFAGTALQFVFPVIMYNFSFQHDISQKQKILNYFYLGIGIIGGLASTIFSIVDLCKSDS